MATMVSTLQNIINKCPDKDKVKRHREAVSFGIGFGLALTTFPIIVALSSYTNLIFVVISLILLILSAYTTHLIRTSSDKNQTLSASLAMVGISLGYLMTFSFTMMINFMTNSPTGQRYYFVAVSVLLFVCCAGVLVLASFSMNAYVKCGKNSRNGAFEAILSLLIFCCIVIIVTFLYVVVYKIIIMKGR